MVEHVGGWLGPGKWDLSGDIRLGYLGRDGSGSGTGLFGKCDTTSSSFFSCI